MDSLDARDCLDKIKRMMQLIGTWPKKSPPFSYKILGFLTMFSLTSFIATTLAQVFGNFKEIENLSYGLSVSTAAFQSFLRHMVLFRNRDKFARILHNLKHPLFNSQMKQLEMYLKPKIRMCNALRTVLLGSSLMTVALLAIGPIFNIKSGKTLPVPFPVNMKEQPFILYMCVFCFQLTGATAIAWTLPCLDSLIFTFMWIAVAQLQLLREKLQQATDMMNLKTKDSEENQNNNEAIYNLLKSCVVHHVAIEKYTTSIEQTFTAAFLIQLTANLIITCMIGFNFILVPVTSIQFGRCLFFFVAVMMEFALFCIPGNELLLQSEKIGDACYAMEWNHCKPYVQKALFLMMERAKRPFIITAGKFMTLSLDSLLTVWKSAFSYFTVLWRLYSDSQ